MPLSATGRVTSWSKGPPRGFTVYDERTKVYTDITDGVDAETLALAAVAKGSKDTVTVTFTTAGTPPVNSYAGLTSP